MSDNEEKYIRLERQYQDSIASQKRYFESEIELLKSKLEYEKEKLKIELENKKLEELRLQKEFYDVKNVKDLEEQKKYFLGEIESLKKFYEKEIENRQKQTEEWHVKHFEEEMTKLKQGYEEMLSANEEKYKVQEELLSQHIIDQKEYYENALKPFNRLKRLKGEIVKKVKKIKIKENKPEKNIRIEDEQCSDCDSGLNTEQKQNIEEVIISNDKTSRPKVSVILPIYNVGKYLRESLDSLINQTLKDIEIICVNDGSTDDCFEILEEYKEKDNRIKVIHKENGGTGAARNDGLRIARGECIGFVDPDDWVKPNMYERLYGLIKEKNLEIAMCMPDGYDEKNAVNAAFPYFCDENFEKIIDDRVFNWRDLSPFSYPMCVWNKLYTKELFDKNKIEFAEGLDFEDHKVIFGTLLTAERMYFIKEKLYVYRYNREGSVLTDNNNRLIDHIEIFNIVENLMKETNTYNVLRKDFLDYKIHNLLYYYSKIKEEFKSEYYENMIKSIKDTNLSEDEITWLSEKYPELKEISLFKPMSEP